jgi:hypothetical protein
VTSLRSPPSAAIGMRVIRDPYPDCDTRHPYNGRVIAILHFISRFPPSLGSFGEVR